MTKYLYISTKLQYHIYINPIFAAGEYHKYDLVDYYHVDPCFGSNEEFKQLVDTFHENGLKVIID